MTQIIKYSNHIFKDLFSHYLIYIYIHTYIYKVTLGLSVCLSICLFVSKCGLNRCTDQHDIRHAYSYWVWLRYRLYNFYVQPFLPPKTPQKPPTQHQGFKTGQLNNICTRPVLPRATITPSIFLSLIMLFENPGAVALLFENPGAVALLEFCEQSEQNSSIYIY